MQQWHQLFVPPDSTLNFRVQGLARDRPSQASSFTAVTEEQASSSVKLPQQSQSWLPRANPSICGTSKSDCAVVAVAQSLQTRRPAPTAMPANKILEY